MAITREIAPANFRTALAHMTAHDVPISPAVAAAAAELDRVESIKPAPVTPADLAALYRNPKAKPGQLVLFAAEVSTFTSRSQAWRQAWTGAGLTGLTTLSDEAGDIVESLRSAAEAHIEIVRWFAEAGSPDVSLLVREGRTADAEKAAHAPIAFAAWEQLMVLRRSVSRFDWTRAGRWENPEHVAAELDGQRLTGLELIAAGVRAGGRLRWATLDQAAALTARIIDAEDQADIERAAEQRRIFQSAI